MESDWIWVSLSALWERWFPDQPSFEMLDDKLQAGYDLRHLPSASPTCRIWLEAWNDVLRIFDKSGMLSIRQFDERFAGTHFLSNWIQDLEDELWRGALEDKQFLTARIDLCEEALRRFPKDDGSTVKNRLRAIAESYFELGETGKAEALYREWLNGDPRWGWGWIAWSDCYRFTHTASKDLVRCEQLLREGLAVANIRDRADLVDRLADLCQEQGRGVEATELRRPAIRNPAVLNPAIRNQGSAPARVGKSKVGRNEPCPCGSGKKFKKCCGV